MPIRKKLGQLLVESGMLDEYQLKSALGFQKKWGGRLGKVLVDNHFVTEEALVQVLKQQTGLAVVELDQRNIPEYLLKLVPFELAEANNLIPVVLEGGPGLETLVVAISDPTNTIILDELRARTGKRVRPVIGSESAIGRAIVRCYSGRTGQTPPGGTEVPPPALDGEPEMVLVQGRLEEPPQGAAQPAGGMTAAVDPFAELDALAQSRRPSATGLQPVSVAPPVAPDPLAGFDPPSPLHPAATPFDLGGSVDVLFDDEPGGRGARPPGTGAPPPPPTAGEADGVEELELVEDIEEVDGPASDQVTPVPGPAPAPPASVILSPDFFSGEGARLPPDLAEAFAADALEAVGELGAPPQGAPELTDLGQPADLSDVPDLDLAPPPSAVLALESPSEPVDLSVDGEGEEQAPDATRDREPTLVSRVSAQMARGLEAQRSSVDAATRPAPASPPAASPTPQARPAAKPTPAAGAPASRPVPATPSVAVPSAKASQVAAPVPRPAQAVPPSRPAQARSTVGEVEPPSARPKTGSGKAGPGSPAMQALLAKVGIRKGADETAGPPVAGQPAPQPAAQPPPTLPAPPQVSLDAEPPVSPPREAPTVIRPTPPVRAEEGTQPRALTLADPVLRALIKVLADKGVVTEREIIEELLRG
jgi:hypothetical protein